MARSRRIRPLEAHRAMQALSENPDDTAQAFRVVSAIPCVEHVSGSVAAHRGGPGMSQ